MQTTRAFTDAIVKHAASLLSGGTLTLLDASGSPLVRVSPRFVVRGTTISLSAPVSELVAKTGSASRWSITSGNTELASGSVSEDMEMLNPSMIQGGKFTLHSFNIKVVS